MWYFFFANFSVSNFYISWFSLKNTKNNTIDKIYCLLTRQWTKRYWKILHTHASLSYIRTGEKSYYYNTQKILWMTNVHTHTHTNDGRAATADADVSCRSSSSSHLLRIYCMYELLFHSFCIIILLLLFYNYSCVSMKKCKKKH